MDEFLRAVALAPALALVADDKCKNRPRERSVFRLLFVVDAACEVHLFEHSDRLVMFDDLAPLIVVQANGPREAQVPPGYLMISPASFCQPLAKSRNLCVTSVFWRE
jgi:hypothetical protein